MSYSHLTASCRMKLLLFQRKLLWSLRTWQNGHSPISPSGSVVSGLSRSSRWMWGRMGRRRPWRDTDNPRSTAAWTSKTSWRKRLTLVSIPYFLLWGGARGWASFKGRWAWSCQAVADSQGMSVLRAEVWWWGGGVVSSLQAPWRLAWGNSVIPVCSIDASLNTKAHTLKMRTQVIVRGSPWGSAGRGIRSELCIMGRGVWHIFLRPPPTGGAEQRPFTSHVPSSRSTGLSSASGACSVSVRSALCLVW